MPEPVIVAVPPKGGSLNDVLGKLIDVGWIDGDLIGEVRRLVKEDKRRIKLEEALIHWWDRFQGDRPAIERAADEAGHDSDQVAQALDRMRRFRDDENRDRLGFTPKAGVDALLEEQRHCARPLTREAAMVLHLELDLTRYGRPTRMMFDHLEFETRGIHGVLVGTDHEVTPTYIRRHKRDLTLTCYDAFQNTLTDALDTSKVHNWCELMEHLIEVNTDVRILGSLGLGDYLGHFVLMPEAKAQQIKALDADRQWNGIAKDPKLPLLAGEPVLIDGAYEGLYIQLLDALDNDIRFEHTSKDIEQLCATAGRTAIYIVQSGGTIARTPGLYVVGAELITSETIVAVNQDRLEHNAGVGILVDSLAPSAEDRSAQWRNAMAERLGDRLL